MCDCLSDKKVSKMTEGSVLYRRLYLTSESHLRADCLIWVWVPTSRLQCIPTPCSQQVLKVQHTLHFLSIQIPQRSVVSWDIQQFWGKRCIEISVLSVWLVKPSSPVVLWLWLWLWQPWQNKVTVEDINHCLLNPETRERDLYNQPQLQRSSTQASHWK